MNLAIIIVLMLVSYAILYFVIKAAVYDALMEARRDRAANADGSGDAQEVDRADDGGGIAKVRCPACGQLYDMDYPKCPYCRNE